MSSTLFAVETNQPDVKISLKGTSINLSFSPGIGALGIKQSALESWIKTGAEAVADYYHGFPVKNLNIIINASGGKRVNGTTYAGLKPLIVLNIGDQLSLKKLKADWVLVHEMVHLAFPSVSKSHHWMEEGLATYVEPVVRVQAGLLSEKDAWRWILTGVPKGQPKSGDRGLDYTPTWGRTYWGGALFCLLADYEIRKQTQNRSNLGVALRAITKSGGNMQREGLWSITEAFKIGDKATGTKVLMTQYQSMRDKPVKVDLKKIWKKLGVSFVGRKVVFDDKAPQHTLRHAIFSKK